MVSKDKGSVRHLIFFRLVLILNDEMYTSLYPPQQTIHDKCEIIVRLLWISGYNSTLLLFYGGL